MGGRRVQAFCDHHVALRTADLDAAVRFWSEALGTRLVLGPVLRSGPLLDTAYGPGTRARIAHLAFERGGVELFEFEGAAPVRPSDQRGDTIMHFALTVESVESAVASVVAAGGAALFPIVRMEDAGVSLVYCETPEGHVFELVDAEYETVLELLARRR